LRRFTRYGPTFEELAALVDRQRLDAVRRTMARIMIRCPKTQRPIPTGIAADPAAYETLTLEGNSVKCPACGETHVWDKKDAFLEGQRD
jgi:hypothetical protein